MWQKEGSPEFLAHFREKTLIRQRFVDNNTGQRREASLFATSKNSAMIFPLTEDNHVIITRQFRWGSAQLQIEPPAGNIEKGESPEETAARELREETGYRSERMIPIPAKMPVWIDPPSFLGHLHFFLAFNCVKQGSQKLDPEEEMAFELIPLSDWLSMCWNGSIDDMKTLAVTFLALPYLIEYNIKYANSPSL